VDGSPYIIGTCGEVGKAALVRVDDDRGWLEILRAHLEDPATTTVMHNAMFDVRVLERVNIHPHHWIDTMQVAFLIQGLPLGLKELAYRLLRVRMTTYKEAVGGSADLSSVPWTTAMTYAGADPDMTLRILNTLTSIMYEGMSNVLTRDMAVQPMVMAMMERGIRLDKPYVMGMEAELELRNMDLLEQIREWGGPEFNPASGDQVAWLLYDILGVNDGVRLKRTKKGRYSTDAKAVKQLKGKHELVKLIAEWKETDTLIDKYIAVLPKKVRGDGRIHANLSMVRVPHSGRLAATNPNLLAQPIRSDDGKRIRNAYVAEEGYSFVSCDYDQQEMRIMAHLSGDPTMLSAYREGKDVHTETAMRVFHISDPKKVDKEKHRRPAKAVSFGIIYGISPRGLSEQLGDWSEQQCERLLEEWFIVYPGVREYMEKVAAHVRRYWHITDMWGRRTRFPDVRSVYEPTVTAAIRKAVNQTIQGSAQGQTKQAMVELWPLVKEWMAEGLVFPILQVHDDLLWEVRDDAVREVVPYIKVVMENVAALDVPVIVETKVGKRWGELVPV
jgi:DNA polymerase-1